MVVNLTPNLSLAKPTEVELAANWTRFTQLMDDNNDILVAEMDKAYGFYSPVLAAQTTPPSYGINGSANGEYIDFGGFIFGSLIITFNTSGGGVTSGSGEYGISLPFPVDGSFHTVGTAFNQAPGSFSVIGEGYYYDASAADTSGSAALDVVTVGGVSYLRMLTEAHTSPAKTSRMFRDSMPFAMADQDRFIADFFYRRT